jgi:hypothetical protein
MWDISPANCATCPGRARLTADPERRVRIVFDDQLGQLGRRAAKSCLRHEQRRLEASDARTGGVQVVVDDYS